MTMIHKNDDRIGIASVDIRYWHWWWRVIWHATNRGTLEQDILVLW